MATGVRNRLYILQNFKDDEYTKKDNCPDRPHPCINVTKESPVQLKVNKNQIKNNYLNLPKETTEANEHTIVHL